MIKLENIFLVLLLSFFSACSSIPKNTTNSCSIFNERYLWYKHAKNTEKKWGTPIYVQLAIIKMESEKEINDCDPEYFLKPMMYELNRNPFAEKPWKDKDIQFFYENRHKEAGQ